MCVVFRYCFFVVVFQVTRSVDATVVSVTLTGLRGNSQYSVTVWATTIAGIGMGNSVMVMTDAGPRKHISKLA